MNRKTPSISFNMEDSYEIDLYEYAMKQDKYFSKYVKRLIERDRSGVIAAVPSMIPIQTPDRQTKVGKTIAKGFL